MEHVRQVLTLHQRAGVTLKVKKCTFSTTTASYLESVIQPSRLETAFHTADAIKRLQQPRKITELRSFLGLCSLFRRLVSSFARLAAPLNCKLQKD